MEDRDVLVLEPSEETDPGGGKLAGALNAHVAFERHRVHRRLLVYVVAFASVLVWPVAAWPQTFPPWARGSVLALWAVFFAAFVFIWTRERASLRARDRMADLLRRPDSK